MSHAELEIALRRAGSGGYLVTLRFEREGGDVEVAPVSGAARIDPDELHGLLHPDRHGEALTRAVFADARLVDFFGRVRSHLAGDTLRVRLFVDESAPELHALRWELLRDPETGAPFSSSERVLFSRRIAGSDWRAIRLGTRARLRALVAVAGGTGLDRYGLAPIDVRGEIERARAGLGEIAAETLGEGEPVTLPALLQRLRERQPEILYLVAHGLRSADASALVLQDETGAAKKVDAAELARQVGALAEPPRLVVLASCESAGSSDGDRDPRTALAPLLSRAGVPAIVAMQGRLTMTTAARMLPVLFAELRRDGQIDRALAAARSVVREHTDAWVPALFLHLKRGRLWREEAPPAPRPFLDLAPHLREAAHPPTWDDLEQRRLYHDAQAHARLEGCLLARRKALLVGRSGSGKSALAYSVGHRFLQADPSHRVFYTHQPQESAGRWLEAMHAHDSAEVLFIVDDAHRSLEACSELAEALPQLRRARVLLVSQPLNPAVAGPEDESYFDLLAAVTLELRVDAVALAGVLEALARRASGVEVGDAAAVLARCKGNLHLLRFYLKACEEQPGRRLSDVEESAVLTSVYRGYLKRRPHALALARLSVLSQFEIPAERRLLGADADALAADPLCESLNSPRGEAQLQIYHATPARYLARAYVHEMQGARHAESWQLQVLEEYLRGGPGNLFSALIQLYRIGRADLQHELFARLPLEELFATHLEASATLAELDASNVARVIRGVWVWEKRAADGSARALIRRLDGWIQRTLDAHDPAQEAIALSMLISFVLPIAPEVAQTWFVRLDLAAVARRWEEVGLSMLRNFLQAAAQADLGAANLRAVVAELDWAGLGRRAREVGLATVRSFLQRAAQLGVDKADLRAFAAELDWADLGRRAREVGLSTVKAFLESCVQAGVARANLRLFAAELDWVGMGRRSRDVGLATVRLFVQLTSQVGADRAKLRAFVAELDWSGLGRRARDVGITTVGAFLELCAQTGADRANLRAFASELDWADLGHRSREVGAATVFRFLRSASQIGVDEPSLRAFTARLDWRGLGRSHCAENGAPTVQMLFVFRQLITSEHIDPGAARDFVEGIGWANLCRWMDGVFSIDVRIACRDFLYTKCGFTQKELMARRIDFRVPAWQRSFLRPIGKVWEGQRHLQDHFLSSAMDRLGPNGLSEILRGVRDLRELNILIHNTARVEPTAVARVLGPELEEWQRGRWQRLLDTADLRNVSTFLRHFSPQGPFAWTLPPDLMFPLAGKLKAASLEELAYTLYNFRHIRRSDLCFDLALHLETWPGVADKIAGASLQHVEFFLWNYWLALPADRAASLVHLPGLVDTVLAKTGDKMQHEVHLLGLLGTWLLAGGPELERLRPVVRPGEARRLCLELAGNSPSILPRSLLGLSLVGPPPSPEDAAVYRAALAGAELDRDIPALRGALQRVDAWLGVAPGPPACDDGEGVRCG